MILFSKFIFKILGKSHDETRFYYGHSSYSIEVSLSPQPPLPPLPPNNTHTHTHTHKMTHTQRDIIRSINNSRQLPRHFHLRHYTQQLTYIMCIMLVHNIQSYLCVFLFSSGHAKQSVTF